MIVVTAGIALLCGFALGLAVGFYNKENKDRPRQQLLRSAPMPSDPKTLRINDADVPDRLDQFEKNIKRVAADGNEVIRQLIDAWNLFIEENGHAPTYPVRLLPAIVADPKRRAKK